MPHPQLDRRSGPAVRACSSTRTCIPGDAEQRAHRRPSGSSAAHHHRAGRGDQPGRRPHPAHPAQPDHRDLADQRLPAGRGRQPARVPVRQARPAPACPGVPKPVPAHEIWVYSPRLEGVHLRFGDVARGGLRWSDRPEDFRTEILGLVKAQEVKNAVIVPVGAKGGFVRQAAAAADRRPAGRPGTAAGRGHRLLPDVHRRAARPDRQPAWPGDRAAGAGGPPRRRRLLPGGRRRQGHRDLLRHRQRRRRTTTASGWATPSPPAAASATTTRPWASPPAAPGSRSSTTSVNSGSTPRPRTSAASASATCPATSSATECCCPSTSGCSPRSTTGTSSSTPNPDIARVVRRAAAAVRAAALVLGRLRPRR